MITPFVLSIRRKQATSLRTLHTHCAASTPHRASNVFSLKSYGNCNPNPERTIHTTRSTLCCETFTTPFAETFTTPFSHFDGKSYANGFTQLKDLHPDGSHALGRKGSFVGLIRFTEDQLSVRSVLKITRGLSGRMRSYLRSATTFVRVSKPPFPHLNTGAVQD